MRGNLNPFVVFHLVVNDALVRAALSHYAKLELARIHEFRYLAIEVPS